MYGGEGSLNEKRSLGGVRRETIGAAETAENAAANSVAASRMKRGFLCMEEKERSGTGTW